MSIEAWTLLRRSTRQITMPHNLRLWKKLMEIDEQISDSLLLFFGERIGRLAIFIQSTLIADANATSIIRNAMRPYFQQHSVLRLLPILSDIEVIADVIKPTSLMVAAQQFHTIVLISSASRAMQNQIFNVVSRHILTLSHNS